MKRPIKFFLSILMVAVAASLIFTGCAPTPTPVTPIKIGANLELTGPGALYGTGVRDGIILRLEEANYQVAGRPIEIIIEDERTDPAVALEKAKKLVELDEVDLTIGPVWSDGHFMVAPYLAEKNILAVASNGVTWDLATTYNNWIGYDATTYMNFSILGQFAYDQGYRTMATMAHDYAAGYEMMGGTADFFEEAGGTVVSQQWVPYPTADYMPYIAELKAAGADVFAFAIWEPDVFVLINQMHEFGITTPWMTRVDELAYPDSLAKFGPIMEGRVGLATYPRLNTPESDKFDTAFQAMYGKLPGGQEFRGYCIMSIILAGLEATGGDPRLEVLRPAIMGLTVNTPGGPVSFSPRGVAIANHHMAEAKEIDGKYEWEHFITYPGWTHDPRDN